MKKLTYKYKVNGHAVNKEPNAVVVSVLAVMFGGLIYTLLTQF